MVSAVRAALAAIVNSLGMKKVEGAMVEGRDAITVWNCFDGWLSLADAGR